MSSAVSRPVTERRVQTFRDLHTERPEVVFQPRVAVRAEPCKTAPLAAACGFGEEVQAETQALKCINHTQYIEIGYFLT